MSLDFKPFARAVHARLTALSQGELFVVGDHATQDALYEHYLASFPAGTNPVYIKNTEHDCSCCRNFIKNFGRVVAISENGKIQTVWDLTDDAIDNVDVAYRSVAGAMASFVRSQAITDLFRTKERSYGAEVTKQLVNTGNGVQRVQNWHHFHGTVAAKHLTGEPDKVRGNYRTTVQVFKRGLEELTIGALDTVLGLIEANALYRGAEFEKGLKAFRAAKALYDKQSADTKEILLWLNADSPAARFRNTAMGTLVQDLSEGMELEKAVRSFEAKVAPTNYKRTTALITPRMVEDAMKTIRENDLEGALQRRFAKLSDVSVNNVLWVDNSVQGKMRDGIEGLLMQAAAVPASPATEKAERITIDTFMESVVPQAKGIEVFVRNGMQTNFVSLTAPVHADTGKLLAWNNDFAWSYDGNVTDSIKEKVKRAGGNVTTAKLRISLAWFNYDDLDIHVWTPNGSHIYFGNKQGVLDVDMNAGGGRSREPVENLSFTAVQDGIYRVAVDQFSRRETTDIGFQLEVESGGNVQQFSHAKAAVKGQHVLDLEVRNGAVVNIKTQAGIVGGNVSVNKWGVDTETYVKVNTLMKSPNHWDGNQVGQRHWFFMLAGCNNDQPTRGIYNEYLNPALTQHRKVFEVLGDKTKCQPTADQLSGVGFTSARGDTLQVRVTGAKTRKTYNIFF